MKTRGLNLKLSTAQARIIRPFEVGLATIVFYILGLIELNMDAAAKQAP
jgi:hypothetical protein